jgi:hypothetical protein
MAVNRAAAISTAQPSSTRLLARKADRLAMIAVMKSTSRSTSIGRLTTVTA